MAFLGIETPREMLTEHLSKELIYPDIRAIKKDDVVRELSEMVSVSMGGRPAAEELYKALSEREYIDSTALENGVAIPHAKMEGLERPVIAIARSRKGCDFDSHDKMPTHLFFILLAPSGAFSEHIKLLARLAKVLSVKGLKEKLLEAPTLENIYMCLAEAEKKL